jgi:hypothetical protein
MLYEQLYEQTRERGATHEATVRIGGEVLPKGRGV